MNPLLVLALCLMFMGADLVTSELPPRDHVHYELKTSPATGPITMAVSANAEPARVIYLTEARLDRTGGHPGKMSEPIYFPTVAAAQKAGIPPAYVTGHIVSSIGSYAWDARFKQWLVV